MDDFNLADVLRGQLKGTEGAVSKLDTAGGREQIEYIPLERIVGDPNNFYELSGLEELAANIELLGLQQPLRVRADPADPDRVIVVSGHRRRAALEKLVTEGRTDLQEAPCIREQADGSAALQELRLIYANSDTRVLSSAELSRQAERVEQLLYQLKEEGMEFPGRMRDHVAQACKISAPKLARLKVIRENLAPAYMELFEKNDLPEQTAYTLARLPAEFQERMASALPKTPSAQIVEKVLKKYNEGWRWEPDLQCPDGTPCKRGDVFLRRDCETAGWQPFCGGEKCCLRCSEASSSSYPCKRMCSKAKAKRKTASAEAVERELQRKRTAGRRYQKETQGYAKRLLRAVDAAGLPEDETITWEYYGRHPVSKIRRWAAGEFDDPAGWSYARLKPGECPELAKMASLLDCSTDFLMGLTEALRPPEIPGYPSQEALTAGDEDSAGQAEAFPEEPAQDVSNLDTSAPETEEDEDDERVVRRVRWESRGRTPPERRLILTCALGPDGPGYRAVVWTGSEFKDLNSKEVLPNFHYTGWLELPSPGTLEDILLPSPECQPEGQLVISGWMPGGTFPREPCEVVAYFHVGSEDGPAVSLWRICWFDGADFLFKRHGPKVDAECIRWMALPPVPNVSDSDTNAEAQA